MSPPNDREKSFAQFLRSLDSPDNRGALAALRRGLGKPPGETPEQYPYVMPWLGEGPSRQDEQAYFLVASLFGLYQGSWPGSPEGAEGRPHSTNLGASIARLRDGKQDASLERRFTALLNAHADDLVEHLRHIIGLLASKEAPVDWAQLLHDIRGWSWEGQPVQREWARAFWYQPRRGPAENGTTDIEDSPVEN